MAKGLRIKVAKREVEEFCRSYRIRRLSFFGSVLSDKFNPQSDVDVLIEFEAGKQPGLLGMARLEQELSTILGGRKVDARTPQELSKYFRDNIVGNAKVQYASR